MTLSRNAAAFSIDALLSRQDTSDSKHTTKTGAISRSSNPCPILDAALNKPTKKEPSNESRQNATHNVVISSAPTSTLPLDFASSFASIESRLRQISVRSPGLSNYPANGGVTETQTSTPPRPDLFSPSIRGGSKTAKMIPLEQPLTIPSFKIHTDSTRDNIPPSADRPSQADFKRRHSGQSTTSTEKAGIEEALACLKHNAAVNLAADKPLAVERWVRSTLEFTKSQKNESGNQFSVESAPVFQTADGIKVTLVNADLWKKFNNCGTEMILNRAGRRMFPSILVSIDGLEESALYRIRLHITPADAQRYKFINCQWLPVGKADNDTAQCTYFEHHDSPNTGAFWMKGNVSFSKLKITNNKDNVDRNIVLNSMHKYVPLMVIIREQSHVSKDVHPQITHFSFPETTFIAVTAYQNEQITQLKIQNNPFAKAFRDADVAALLQSAHGLTPEMAFGEGYSHTPPFISRRGSSPDYRPFSKFMQQAPDPATALGETRRRSLPVTPYSKPPSYPYLRPPTRLANMPWYNKSDMSCRLPRETDPGGSACSSMSSLASQESGFGDSMSPLEIPRMIPLTKCKSTEVYTEKQEKEQQRQSATTLIGATGGNGSLSCIPAGGADTHWTHLQNPHVSLAPSQSLNALHIRSQQIHKRRSESSNPAFNLSIPVKRCRSISPARSRAPQTEPLPSHQ